MPPIWAFRPGAPATTVKSVNAPVDHYRLWGRAPRPPGLPPEVRDQGITGTADRAMICTADHRASSAGLAILRAGGSAADAAVAANAVLAVVAPHRCGLGGDLFALVHDRPGPPAALNASGRAGSGADAAALRAEGRSRM